jgi:hypothetical protein
MRTLDHRAAHEYLAGLEPATRTTVLHLLSCPACRRTLRPAQTEELRVLLASLGAATTPPPPTTPRRPPGRAGSDPFRIGLEVAVGVELADRLEALPLADARRHIARDPELRQPIVARALLHRADDCLADAATGGRLAELAIEILAPLAGDAHGSTLELLVRAFWHRVRSLTHQGRLREADDVYRTALPLLAALDTASDSRATLLVALAQLRWRDHRVEEAAALFSHAGRAFAEAPERQGEAAAHLQSGFAFLADDNPRRARTELALAHAHLDADLAPALAARTALALAWCNAAMGLVEQARERLRGARGLYFAAPAAGEETFRSWWEGRIAALDHQDDRAASLLDTARRELLAAGSVAEAAAAAVDLLPLRPRRTPGAKPPDLAGELTAAFPASSLAAELADRIGNLAATAPGTARDAAIAALRRQLAADSGPCGPGDRPPFIPDLQALADQLLVDHRRGFAARP